VSENDAPGEIADDAEVPLAAPPPVTGVAEIDEALAAVDLSGEVSTHPQALAEALEVLQAALNRPQS
jgi:hypothetical protein